jgi:hypothetical protein
VSGTVDGIGKVVSVLLSSIGGAGLVAEATAAGPSVLGGLFVIALVVVVYSRGVSSWMAHDAIERRAIRGERLRPAGTGTARGEAILVIGGLAAVVIAAWVGDAGITLQPADAGSGTTELVAPFSLLVFALAAVVGFVGRRSFGPRGSHSTAAARVDAMVGSASRRY